MHIFEFIPLVSSLFLCKSVMLNVAEVWSAIDVAIPYMGEMFTVVNAINTEQLPLWTWWTQKTESTQKIVLNDPNWYL
jgi:hypothetical protein